MKGYVREDLPYDPFDPFTRGYREVARMLTAPAVDIQVEQVFFLLPDFSEFLVVGLFQGFQFIFPIFVY